MVLMSVLQMSMGFIVYGRRNVLRRTGQNGTELTVVREEGRLLLMFEIAVAPCQLIVNAPLQIL